MAVRARLQEQRLRNNNPEWQKVVEIQRQLSAKVREEILSGPPPHRLLSTYRQVLEFLLQRVEVIQAAQQAGISENLHCSNLPVPPGSLSTTLHTNSDRKTE